MCLFSRRCWLYPENSCIEFDVSFRMVRKVRLPAVWTDTVIYRALYDNEHRTDINEGRFHKHGHLLFFPRDIPSGASTTLVLLSNISSPNRKCKGVDVHATPIRASVPNLSMQATQGTFSRYARRSILLHATHQRLDRLRSICVGNYPTLAPNCCQALYANKVDSYYRNVSGIVARR